jgi:hypothetical protein
MHTMQPHDKGTSDPPHGHSHVPRSPKEDEGQPRGRVELIALPVGVACCTEIRPFASPDTCPACATYHL